MNRRTTLSPHALVLLFTLAVLTCGRAEVYAADCPTCQASFTSPKKVTAGDFFQIVPGDFNGDNRLDLVARNSNGVVFLAGDGAGNFGAPVVTALATPPSSVAAGDFNGDGKLDLVVTEISTSVVKVLLGDGSGHFAVHQTVAAPTAPRRAAAADFNRDGKLDLAVLSQPFCTGEGDISCAANTVTVFSGDGAGNLAPVGSFSAGASLSSEIAAADFNGDGKVDLAALGEPSGGGATNPAPVVLVWFGDGDGGFGQPPTRLGRADHLAAGDFDGDGTADLAATTPDKISIYLADGASGFTQFDNPNYPLPDTSRFASLSTMITAGDFDGDGNADVAVNNPFRDFAANVNWSAYVPLGDGSGGLETPAPTGVGSTATFLAVGDFDSDGRPDLAAVNGSNNPGGAGLSVMLNRTDCSQPMVCVRPGEVTLAEGNLGTVNADVTVSLSAPAGHTVTVDFNTAEYEEPFHNSAQSGIDFKPAAGTLTFAPGVTTQTVRVEVFGDAVYELDEPFRVALSNATGAGVAGLPFIVKPPLVRILNDDPRPSGTPVKPHVSIGDATVVEGDGGTTQAVFVVTFGAPLADYKIVNYSTTNGTATNGTDYDGVDISAGHVRSIYFAPGDTVRTIMVPVRGDTAAEGDETFFVNLTPDSERIHDRARGTGTIIDDDTPRPDGAPYLFTDETGRAIALDSVTFTRDPFSLDNPFNFSSDHRTRIMLFARGLNLAPGERASAVSAVIRETDPNAVPNTRQLTVEEVAQVPGTDDLFQIVVRLPDGLPEVGDKLVFISVHDLSSNKGFVTVAPR